MPGKSKAKQSLPCSKSKGYMGLIDKKRSLEKFTDHLIYKGLRNKVTTQLRKAKPTFSLKIIKSSKRNCTDKLIKI